ncbi:GNAT family N-acetyltransferase [Cellulomonas dongxiuzhuiae]|uniref:GNAT family N-acetyltransferase n=1 Tax=Cellulomonas dongxiuzhuiae TaxID=2819979 RepID=A0ABX8GFQ9_9CELL|nr:GNAT family N-acetyltransferase [Cellulomonas dongxiuzhuiae]QWC14690.1 GNAT family N-acetyltransferase [Cellulomonas dongxiuzhuiae]
MVRPGSPARGGVRTRQTPGSASSSTQDARTGGPCCRRPTLVPGRPAVRPGVHVRPVSSVDLEDLVDLCLQARAESGVGRQLCSDDRDRLREHLSVLAAAPDGLTLVATCDGEPAGLVLGRLLGPGLMSDTVVLSLDAVYVRPQQRRRGLGHAMLQAVAELAETTGVTDVYAAPLPGSRGMQRFLARLGFAPAAAHRVVSTGALLRRLALDVPAPARRGGTRGLEDLIERRRRARARALDEEMLARQATASMSMQVRRAVHNRRPSSSSTTTS